MTKNKKGYALATTLIAMMIVLAVSSLVLVLVATTSNTQKIETKLLNNKIFVSQIAIDYSQRTNAEFENYYIQIGWEKNEDFNFIKEDCDYQICLTDLQMQVKNLNGEVKAKLTKNVNGEVVEWLMFM